MTTQDHMPWHPLAREAARRQSLIRLRRRQLSDRRATAMRALTAAARITVDPRR